MADDRSTFIKLGDKEYELLLTTKAIKDIATRYGGLEKIGDKLKVAVNNKDALNDFIWLIVTLANQPILINNYKNKDKQEELLTEETVELLTTPADFNKITEAITKAFEKGTNRNIVSEKVKNEQTE